MMVMACWKPMTRGTLCIGLKHRKQNLFTAERRALFGGVALLLFVTCLAAQASDPQWQHLSSATGDLPVPGPGTEQTACIVGDFDQDGTNDFILAFRKTAPALVWYRRNPPGWDRSVIESNFLTVEAGGA